MRQVEASATTPLPANKTTMNIFTPNTLQARARRIALALLTLAVAAPMAVTNSALAQDKMAPSSKMAMSSKMTSSKMSDSISGGFTQVTHATKGTATLANRTVRLSNFSTAMGPQLRVYLVSGAAKDNASIKKAIAAGKFVNLGNLKSLKGNQSYAVPTSSKLGKGSSVVIWCDKFNVAFGSAALA